jgi:hypothetical protein
MFWRAKEMYDRIGDLMVTGEIDNDEACFLYSVLGMALEQCGGPRILDSGFRKTNVRALLQEWRAWRKRRDRSWGGRK